MKALGDLARQRLCSGLRFANLAKASSGDTEVGCVPRACGAHPRLEPYILGYGDSEDEGEQEQGHEHDDENLGYLHRESCDPSCANRVGDEGDYQEDYCQAK